jgi:hypothetical protein
MHSQSAIFGCGWRTRMEAQKQTTVALVVMCRDVSAHVLDHRPGDQVMNFGTLLVLSAAAVALSAQPSLANPCSQDIDRAWVEVNAKIQARVAAGRSASQSTTALLYRQPTPSSIAAAEEALVDIWLPMETAVAALARAREADRANDGIACEGALAEVRRVIDR